MDPIYIIGILISVLLIALIGSVLYLASSRKRSDGLNERISGQLQMMLDSHSNSTETLSNKFPELERQITEALNVGLDKGRKEIAQQNEKSQEVLTQMRERLVAITKFAESVQSLNSSVTGLQQIFDNPKQRGLFGEGQLKDIVETALPRELYEFQHSVRTEEGRVVFDCFLKLPEPPGPIGIDSKFPSEMYQRVLDAQSDDEIENAQKQFTAAILKLINDIADKYIIPNVTSEFALMFVPSEAIFAEIYSASWLSVGEMSRKRHVYIVSPATLMASLNTIRAVVNTMNIQKEAAEVLKGLALVAEDSARLKDRSEKIQRQINTAAKSIELVVTSSGKIHDRIEKMQSGNVSLTKDNEGADSAISNGSDTS